MSFDNNYEIVEFTAPITEPTQQRFPTTDLVQGMGTLAWL